MNSLNSTLMVKVFVAKDLQHNVIESNIPTSPEAKSELYGIGITSRKTLWQTLPIAIDESLEIFTEKAKLLFFIRTSKIQVQAGCS